jgi:hypothetical protein
MRELLSRQEEAYLGSLDRFGEAMDSFSGTLDRSREMLGRRMEGFSDTLAGSEESLRRMNGITGSLGTAAGEMERFSRGTGELNVVLEADKIRLAEEVNFLNELLAEKENGVVPCWRRPEGVVPPLVGTITIEGRDDILAIRESDGAARSLVLPESGREEVIARMLAELFSEELRFSREKNCYLRLKIVNETNSFKFYQEVSNGAARAGIVVVQ